MLTKGFDEYAENLATEKSRSRTGLPVLSSSHIGTYRVVFQHWQLTPALMPRVLLQKDHLGQPVETVRWRFHFQNVNTFVFVKHS